MTITSHCAPRLSSSRGVFEKDILLQSTLHCMCNSIQMALLKGVNVNTAEIPHFEVKNYKMNNLLSVFTVSCCSLVYLTTSNMKILKFSDFDYMLTILVEKWVT